jgi:hypothetical protein
MGRLFAALTDYAVVYHAACWAAQLSLFSGCAYKPARHEALRLDPGSCLIAPTHLSALGEPLLGVAALTAAIVACMAGWDRPSHGGGPRGARRRYLAG